MAQSLFFAVDTGMSIGFGAVAEQRTVTKVFTIIHVLLGASAAGGALALFAEAVVADASSLASAELAGASLSAAFSRADTSGDGLLTRAELQAALAEVGVNLDGTALDEALAYFDDDGDGSISVDEFTTAVRPHIGNVGTVDIASAIRTAVNLRTERGLSRAVRQITAAVAQHRVFALWALWIALGAAYGVFSEGWDLVTSIYFAVCGLSTGGLQAPSVRAPAGTLPPSSAIFVALYCLSGVPIFGFALSRFANLFVERHIASKEQRALASKLSPGDFELADALFSSGGTGDGEVDLAEFLALELLRLGKVDLTTLSLLKAEFDRRDRNRNGRLSRAEATGEVEPSERGMGGRNWFWWSA